MIKSITKQNRAVTYNPFSGPTIEKVIHTTASQAEIWIGCTLGGADANRGYNESVSLILKGILNKNALEQAIQHLIKRHEALRSTFSTDGLFMIIFNKIQIVPVYEDFSSFSTITKKNKVSNYLSADANHIFNLAEGPLIKVGILKLSELEHQLIITAHHIICDGWSMGIILQDIGGFYSATITNTPHTLPTANDFSSYADQQQEFIDSEDFITTQKYWLDHYKSSVPKVTLPTDFPRPKIRTFKSNRLDFPINYDLVNDLKKVGIQSRASFVATLMTAFEVFLYYQTGQNDLVIGLSAAGQSLSGKNQLVGHCVSLLPLRSKITPETPFNTYLKQRKDEIFDAYEHQQFSFGQLLEKLNVQRDLSRVPLVPVTFNIDMGMANDVIFEGLTYRLKSNPRAFETFELFLNATGTEEELILEWSYNASLFKPKTIEQMMLLFKEILHSIIENPAKEIGAILNLDKTNFIQQNGIDLSSAKETVEKTNASTSTSFTDSTENETVVEAFLAQVKQSPNDTAIVFGSKKITYQELDTLSNQFSNYIVNTHNVMVNDIVGIMLEQSEWVIVCVLGILKSGAAYVPIAPNYPEKRKNYIISDSQCKITINADFLTNFIKVIDHITPNLNPSIKILPQSLCYVIYTSGTTGNPKGVMNEHRSLFNYLISSLNYIDKNSNTSGCFAHLSLSFDASITEIFLPLISGKRLVITTGNGLDVFEDSNLFKYAPYDFIKLTPSHISIFTAVLKNISDKNIATKYIIGGEALYDHHINNFKTLGIDALIVNEYGPTEATVGCCIKEIHTSYSSDSNESISIGLPISNTQMYILDENLEELPIGDIGELYIAGKGLARGYLNRPELTKERFVTDVFNKVERMYRSGDRAKWLPNGEIAFIGRVDDQVKVRGYRIELSEIESVLNSLPGIKQSVVVTSKHLAGDISLVAYLLPTKDKFDSNTVRNQLKKIMPEFQIPSTMMWVEQFSLTTNGKIDKTNLPRPEYVRSDASTAFKTPQTTLEKNIANVWSEMLQVPDIAINDNFFEMGGSSLMAQRVIGLLRKKINKEIPLIKIFQHPTIAQLAEFLGDDTKVDHENETISKLEKSTVTAAIRNFNDQEPRTTDNLNKTTKLEIQTTKAQSEILTDSFFGGDDAKKAYNISLSFKFVGTLKYDAVEQAIVSLIERHESLRSSFSEDLNLMHIYTDIHVDILFYDITDQSETEQQKTRLSLINKDVNYLFDLVNGPLLKFSLIKINEHEHELILLVNHAVCDGLSINIILEELSELYTAFAQGKELNLNEPDAFSVFATKENEYAESDAYNRSVNFWLNMYKDSIPKLELPIDFPRPELRTYNNHHLDFQLDNSILNALKLIGNSSDSSMFTSVVTTLIAAFEVFLYQQTGQNDLVLGLTSSRRANYDMMQMIGHSVNLLPLRSKLDPKINFKTYLKQRNTQLFDAYENQSISFGHLLRKLSVPRDATRVPLVPVIINIQLDDDLESKHSFYDLKTDIIYNENTYRTFEIELQVFMSNERPCFRWRYNTTLFKPETIERMMTSFKEVLNAIIANPNLEIGSIIQIDTAAYLELNDTAAIYPQLPLHELIAQQCKIVPSKKAIKFGESDISYGDLEKQIHQIAHFLKQQGVQPGDFVAVSLPRSIELITILLAIMESGAAYLPLDPNYPSKRLEFMLEDSGSKYLITTDTSSLPINANITRLLVSSIFSDLSTYSCTPVNTKISINQIAYILYTSGSTGKPKGVTVTHKNLVNLLYSILEKPGVQNTDKVISITSISFDIAGFELYASLLKGAQLILTDEETSKDPRLLLEVLETEEITLMEATPATWQMLIDVGWKNHLPLKAFCTGEALPMALAKNILSKVNELWNLYGPTETTIWSSIKKINNTDDVVTIGKPIANTQLYIMNQQELLVAPGRIGELCIAGDGVAQGYWKRQELTNEKFIKNPFETEIGPVLYRTGDLAKLLPSGEVQCLGRIDHQIKIRGQRVELGEIEESLDALDGVQSSVVLLHEDRLIAYLMVPAPLIDHNNKINEWKETLREQLPPHMVPHLFHIVKDFPITLNGKIDRKSLLKLLPRETASKPFTTPTTPSEKVIVAIWQKCLGLEKIDINSDFFELGGHSVIAVRVMKLLEDETGYRLPLVALLKHPTIRKLATYMDNEFVTWNSLVPLQPNGNKPPLYIVHGAHHNVLIFNELAKNMDKEQPVYGLQARGLDGISEPHESMHDMARDYIKEILITNPDGPFCLAGFSLGGTIAFEMARQLRAQNKKVKVVAEFDTYVFPDYYFKNPLKKKIVGIGYDLTKVGFVLLNMFTSKKNFKRRTGLFKLRIKGIFLRLKYGKEKQHEMQFHRNIKMEQNHLKATGNYHIQPQDIVIDLFKAEEEINLVHDRKYLGWKKIATKGIRRHMVPGNHIDMFDKGNVEVFAAKLQYVLDNHNLEGE
ncbi:non-ribosomal peptide synthetase [Maribacter litoralis]|uniref:non-ribosomal peptide synthetase n=1 Tax=Maribacter litoralis TaxID=2059726 RepID=UPI000E31C506|nr:non-ribosomal peptide synthetase [Maribacter litoralis]